MDSQRTFSETQNQDNLLQYCVCSNLQSSSAHVSTPTTSTTASGHRATRLPSGDASETPQMPSCSIEAHLIEHVDSSSVDARPPAEGLGALVPQGNGTRLSTDGHRVQRQLHDKTHETHQPLPESLRPNMTKTFDSSLTNARPTMGDSIDNLEWLNGIYMRAAFLLGMSVERQLEIADSSEIPTDAAENTRQAKQHLPMALRALTGDTAQQSTAPEALSTVVDRRDGRSTNDPEIDLTRICPDCHRPYKQQ